MFLSKFALIPETVHFSSFENKLVQKVEKFLWDYWSGFGLDKDENASVTLEFCTKIVKILIFPEFESWYIWEKKVEKNAIEKHE